MTPGETSFFKPTLQLIEGEEKEGKGKGTPNFVTYPCSLALACNSNKILLYHTLYCIYYFILISQNPRKSVDFVVPCYTKICDFAVSAKALALWK